jgi:hypothetical protein
MMRRPAHQAPGTQWVEANNQDAPPRDQNPLGLAQHALRLQREVERVRQEQDIDTGWRQGQLSWLRAQGRAAPTHARSFAEDHVRPDTAMLEGVVEVTKATDLDQEVAKGVLDHPVDNFALDTRNLATNGRVEPLG